MKDSRAGETLWSSWDGNDHHSQNSSALIFFTEEHVDIENEIVRRALASAIQRDGSVDSLGQAFAALEGAKCREQKAYAGYVDGDTELTFCDVNGMTIKGDEVEEVIPITLVEIYV
jgi:hypothetical protein